MAAKRDVSPILQWIREYFLGKKNTNWLRFPIETSKRTQPHPVLPEGSNQKLSGNYYYTRDARRLVTPSQTIYEGDTVPKLEASSSAPEKPSSVHRVPGKVHMWDL